MAEPGLGGRRVVVHVGGSVAAYKAGEVITALRRRGAEVRVAMTAGAQHFITATTLRSLSGNPVAVSVWDSGDDATGHGMSHLSLSEWAELQLVVAAPANLLARLALGFADDAVTACALASRAPLLLAPAMETAMWEHPATQGHAATLRSRGVRIIGPQTGRLASGHEGAGRMAEPQELVEAAADALAGGDAWLAGRRVVVTAGGTREPIDPIRYLGNRSSGRMGEALATAAARLGATVVLITTAPPHQPSAGVERVEVETAAELHEAVCAAIVDADVLVMSAAVADHRPARVAEHKLKKRERGGGKPIELVPTTDILADVHRSRRSPRLRVVGFAAETEDLVPNALAKIREKGLDAIVANPVGPGGAMGGHDAEATVIAADGSAAAVPRAAKPLLAQGIWEALRPVLERS
ncbi:MAG: bifunctional phosphopantothenoylcysteine decarboxylase/phosphopantothenate--cysteine ligase CoaBC [Candidatus Dormibacteria bacterium]